MRGVFSLFILELFFGLAAPFLQHKYVRTRARCFLEPEAQTKGGSSVLQELRHADSPTQVLRIFTEAREGQAAPASPRLSSIRAATIHAMARLGELDKAVRILRDREIEVELNPFSSHVHIN